MIDLRQWVIGALMIATVTVGLTGFVSEGLNTYQVSDNVDTGKLDKLQRVQNATSLADKAQQRAENVNAKSNFFTLPGLIKTFKLSFDSIGIWEEFLSVAFDLLGLKYATGQWPIVLGTSALVVSIAFVFASRVL